MKWPCEGDRTTRIQHALLFNYTLKSIYQSRSSHLRVGSSLIPCQSYSNITLFQSRQSQDNNLTLNQCHKFEDTHLNSDSSISNRDIEINHKLENTYFISNSSVSNNDIGINSYEHDVPPHNPQNELVPPENSKSYSSDVNSYELGVISRANKIQSQSQETIVQPFAYELEFNS